jgi:hypothetical protein
MVKLANLNIENFGSDKFSEREEKLFNDIVKRICLKIKMIYEEKKYEQWESFGVIWRKLEEILGRIEMNQETSAGVK